MKRAAAVLLALAVLSACAGRAPAAAEEAHVTRCLAVGMDRFVTQENTAPCSAANAEHMAALLGDFLPEGTQVTARMDGPGTAGELETVIRETFRGAAEGDVSLLYLSTHGVIWEEEGKTGTALILSDGEREDALTPEGLRRMLDPVPGKKVLILDACYSGAFAEALGGEGCRVLASCGAGEKSYFWTAEETGTGYFTAALENALRASAKEQIDPNGDGRVSLEELAGRIREIYGVSAVTDRPEGDQDPLFLLPEDRHAEARVLEIRFDPAAENGGQVILGFRFRTEERTKLEYRLVPAGPDGWDFGRTVHLPDRERTGRVRGLLAPGEKERQLRFSAGLLGELGRALLQVVSLHGKTPVPECTRVITMNQKQE